MEIKNKKFFKSKTHLLIHICAYIVIFILFIYIGNTNFENDQPDNKRFSELYKSVSTNNVYTFYNARETLDLLDETGIILFGSPTNIWTDYYAKIINEVVLNNEVQEIAYYDFFEDRSINNGNYELIVNELESILLTDDAGKKELYAPSLLIIKDGEIIYFHDEINFARGTIEPDKYWTNYKENEFKLNLEAALKIYTGDLDGKLAE